MRLQDCSMANWTIRRADEDDAGPLAQCIDQAYSVCRSRISDLPPVSEGLAQEIHDNLVWVAVLAGGPDGRPEDNIVGGMVLVLQDDHLLLANVAVRPDAAGMGLGRAFLDRAESETKQRGLAKLRLSTHCEMPENVRLYQHLGWHETGRSGNKVMMEKSLSF